MSDTNKLGRGLDALFGGSAPGNGAKSDTSLLPISALLPNPNQPRRYFDEEALHELADSIRVQGIIQPLLVRPIEDGKTWQIVAGERRWRAAQMAGIAQVPVFIRALSDNEVMAAALIENLQREDLNPMEEAQALHDLREALNLTQEDVATRLGKSRPSVANALRLLQLAPAAQEDLRAGRISAGHARCLLGISSPDAAEILRLRIQSHNLTVRQAEEAASGWRDLRIFPWEGIAGNEAEPTPESSRPKRKKSPELRKIQKDLSQNLACNVSISGDENTGRINLAYASNSEFHSLVSLLAQLHA